MKDISIIFMIFLTLTNLFSCARHKSPHMPKDNKINDSSYNKINVSYLDNNYNVSKEKTNILGMSFKDVENIVVFSESEDNNKYIISIVDEINNSVVLMKYGSEKIFPDTISFYQDGTIIKGLIKMNKDNYDYFDITFYMGDKTEIFSSIELTNDIEKFTYNPNLNNKENYQIHIMFNSLLILNSINNYILNYNSNIQTRGGLGVIFSALASIAMGYAKAIAIILGIMLGIGIFLVAIGVTIIVIIDESQKNKSKAKEFDSKFEISMRNSSVIIATKKEKEILNDKDTFDINTTLDLVLTIKSQVGKDTSWKIKITSKDISDEEIKKYFAIKDLIPRPEFSYVVNFTIGDFATGIRHSEYSYHLIVDKLKKLPSNIKSVYIDFDFYDNTVINGYYSTNFSIGVR